MSCDNEEEDFIRGDTWPFQIELSIDGIADDLTGCTLFLTLKADPDVDDDDADFAFEYVVPNGSDATAGKASFTIGSDLTADIEPGDYYMDVQRVRPGSPPDVWTLTDPEKQIRVKRDITIRIA